MKALLLQLCYVVVVLPVAAGCAGVDKSNPNALTIGNLQGTYALNTDSLPGDLAGDDGFKMISEMLEIEANTLTFAPVFAGTGPFSLTGNTLTITDGEDNIDIIQATFSDAGNKLTLVDEINNDIETFVFIRRDRIGASNEVTEAKLQGTYDLDVTNSKVKNFVYLASGELIIAGNVLTASLTFSQARPFSLAGNAITLTETDGSNTLLHAILSPDGNTLTLTFVEDRDTFVYERR